MRKRLIIPALLAMLVLAAVQAFAQTATVVTYSGQRVRGQLVDMGNDGNITVRTFGRDQQIPVGDVMMIDFVGDGRNIPQGELARANQSSDGMVVLRNGHTVNGRLVDMQPYSNRAVVAGNFGEQNLALNQVARVYFAPGNDYGYDEYGNNPNYNPNSNDGNWGQSGNYGQYRDYGQSGNYGGNDDPYGQSGYNNNRNVTIPANRQWTNTGINVQRGETIHFRASGRVSLSHNPGDVGSPAGADDRRLAGNSPLPGVTGGMLIGRVENGQTFAIGAESEITMPASGRLYLGINDDYADDNSGNFVVEMWDR